jgi:predicted acyl esterase
MAERILARRFGLGPATTRYRVTRAVTVPMRDGVNLLADHYSPVTSSPAGTLLLRGPYARDALPTRVTIGLYASRGYHVVLQSTRGSFGSGGVFEPGHGEVGDGADTVSWLRRQPWFTGSFATVGGSYLGFTQLALLADPPPELTTAVVTMGPHAIGHAAWGTGSFALSNFLTWGHQITWHEHGGWVREAVRSALAPRRLRPVFNKLPMGNAADAVLGGSSPFYEAWLQNPDPSGEYWRGRAVAFEAVRQPVLLIGGWQDLFFDQTMPSTGRCGNTVRTLHSSSDPGPTARVAASRLASHWTGSPGPDGRTPCGSSSPATAAGVNCPTGHRRQPARRCIRTLGPCSPTRLPPTAHRCALFTTQPIRHRRSEAGC